MAWWNDYYLESLQGPGSQRPNTSSWAQESVMYTTLEPFQVMQEDFMRRQVEHGSRIQSNMPPQEARQPTLVYRPTIESSKGFGSKDNKCDKRIHNLNATTTCSPVNLTSEDVKTDTSDGWSKSDTAVAKSWKRFSEDETVLLLSVWEGQFTAFTEKKKVKQDDWDDLTVAYNTEAAAYGFQS